MKSNNKGKKYRTGQIGVFLIFTALAFFPLSACSKKTADANDGGKQKPAPFTIIFSSNVITIPISAIAKEMGYYEEEGLNPEYIILNSGSIESLSIGKADVNSETLIPPLSYIAQKSDLKVIAGAKSGGSLVITKPENAEKYSDFANWSGTRLGTVRLSTSEMASRYALGKFGYNMNADDPNQDITFVEIESYPNIIEGVRKGQVDIGFINFEYQNAARDLGLAILFPMTHMYPNYVCCRQTAYGKSLETRREDYVAYLRAQIRAYKDYVEQPEVVIPLLAKASSQEEDYVRSLLYNTEWNGGRTYHPDPDSKRVKEVWDTLLQYKYIPDGVSFDDAMDCTVYRDALNEILERYPNDPLYQKMAQDFPINNPGVSL
jgi:NitT/TauT family transport system substrate-binding protein